MKTIAWLVVMILLLSGCTTMQRVGCGAADVTLWLAGAYYGGNGTELPDVCPNIPPPRPQGVDPLQETTP